MPDFQSLSCGVYGAIALGQAYRFLGLGDRDPSSPAYGCFDRYYWHYKQTDFTNARFQEASHFLALLYHYDHPDNRFFQQSKIAGWAEAAVNYWTKIQRGDGSFDEYWPYERSFCVTSFTLYAASETCRLLSCKPPKDAIHKAASWLIKRENLLVTNQMAASAVALQIGGEVVEDDEILAAAAQRISTVLSQQTEEGYFPEYGGYDIGYQTITLSCLTQFYLHTEDPRIQEAIERGLKFLDDKITENGSYDITKTSRKTQYFYPYGFRVMSHWNILQRHIDGLRRNEVVNPSWCDDRYSLPLAIDYLQTALYDAEHS